MRIFPLVAVTLIAVGQLAQAGVSVTGNAELIAPPADANPGQAVSSKIQVWYEGVSTATNLDVEHIPTGVDTSMSGVDPNPNGVTVNGNTPGTINGDLKSYFIHFDAGVQSTSALATLVFDNPIVGIAYEYPSLIASENQGFGAPGTAYWVSGNAGPTTPSQGRGLEDGNDQITLLADGKTLLLDFITVNGVAIDNIRVFTAVPEFASLLTWSALAGLGCVAGRYRRSS